MVIISGRRVAGLAIGQAGVAKLCVPVVGVVALGTLAGEVAARPAVAALAVGQIDVAEGDLVPVTGVVTSGAWAGEMVSRPDMAAFAGCHTGMIEGDLAPILGVVA
jgi:hypothetical protein